MKTFNLKDFHRGWLFGDFDPALYKTKDFEVGLLWHTAGENWPRHVHKIATEYNVLVKGEMLVNGIQVQENEVFVIEAGEVTKAEFVTDCTVLCIKIPSIPGDKYDV